MKTKVSKWGGSLGIRLPRKMANKIDIREGAIVDLSQRNKKITITKSGHTLEELVAHMSASNLHTETKWQTPVGKEVW